MRGLYENYKWYFADYLAGTGWHPTFTATAISALTLFVFVLIGPTLFLQTLWWWLILFPIWGPLFLAPTWWWWWIRYVQAAYLAKQKHVVLEIKLPKEMKQTPAAMERVFTSFHIRSGQTTFYTRWWKGGIGTYWSFELHSYEGRLRFFVWGRKPFAHTMKSWIYSQYPQVQITEVPDPLQGIRFIPGKMQAWGVEYGLEKKDVLPIKTYIDYGLNALESGRNQEKYSDPLGSIFERFSDIRKGEQAYLQMVIRQVKGARKKPGWFWFANGEKWPKIAQKAIQSMYDNAKIDYDTILEGDAEKGFAQLKPAELEIVRALERSIEKHGFDTSIRVARWGRAGEYRAAINSQQFTQMWKQFQSGKFNSLNTNGLYWHEHIDFAWQDIGGFRAEWYNYELFDCLRRRGGFYQPFEHIYSTFTTEELATIYHFPDVNCEAPGVEYISAKTSEAPANLPT